MTDFPDPHQKINEKIDPLNPEVKSRGVQMVYDNLDFARKVKREPVMNERFNKKIFGVETINLQSYINSRIWTRGIYVTDKLLRLAVNARLEFLKRYLKKKRPQDYGFMWLLILIMIGVFGAVLVIMFFLPKLGGALP